LLSVGEISEDLSAGETLLIPIPITKARRKERGFNQTEMLAENLMKIVPANFLLHYEPNILIKTKETEKQTFKNRAERLASLKDSFQVTDPEKIKDKKIILLDDVVTTGATISEVKRVLKQAHAKSIQAITLAH